MEPHYGFADDVKITLPKSLAAFKPVFTLRYAGQEFQAKQDEISGDDVVLTFAGVGELSNTAPAGDMDLVVDSVFGDFVVTWRADGSKTWSFAGTKGA